MCQPLRSSVAAQFGKRNLSRLVALNTDRKRHLAGTAVKCEIVERVAVNRGENTHRYATSRDAKTLALP